MECLTRPAGGPRAESICLAQRVPLTVLSSCFARPARPSHRLLGLTARAQLQQGGCAAAGVGGAIVGLDARAGAVAWKSEGGVRGHGIGVNDLQFNPRRRDLLVAAREDGSVEFWDVRMLSEPISSIDSAHRHWSNCVR